MTTATEFDFSVPCHEPESAGRVWFPVGFDGTDATGDPSQDYGYDGQSLVFGKVTARKLVRGASHQCYRLYPNRKAARAAAVRLAKKLQAATTVEQHNAIVEAWYAR
jgi:hypothetical protein